MIERVLALDGGEKVREHLLPYGRQSIDEEDIRAVVEVLRSDWLTTGPKVEEFEKAFARRAGTSEAVAVSNGTAALHAAMHAIGVGPGDEVVLPAMTFAATANCVVYLGAKPVFADVDADTLLLDPACAEAGIGPRTKAVIGVDFAGQPCECDSLRALVHGRGLRLVFDACHALGGSYKGRPVGSLGDVSTFSMHPVKHVTSGEGGVVTTDHPDLARRARIFRNHGITSDHRQRQKAGSWVYEMVELGYNYRITDFQCALALSQLRNLTRWVERRRMLARRYDAAFRECPHVTPLAVRSESVHAYHLYVVSLELERLRVDRAQVFQALRAEGIGVNVHYVPVHLHPFYRERFGTGPGMCPQSEKVYERILSLPLFPSMSDADSDDVIEAVLKVVNHYAR